MQLERHIEHTNLSAAARVEDIERLCAEAMEHGLAGVCVGPLFVPRCRVILESSDVRLVSVVGFPLGSSSESSKAFEASELAGMGVDEVDMVIPIGLALSGELDEVRRHVRAVRGATPGVVLKVIIETGYFGAESLLPVVTAVLAEGPEFLKTCTGYGPRGASEDDVRALVRCASGRAEVKASGGIKTRAQALRMLEAGATRIGTSRGVALLS